MSRVWMVILCAFLTGCADFNNPVQKMVDQKPEFTVGMKKNDVLKGWGRPDGRKVVGHTKWGVEVECWTYRAFVPGFPVDYKYFSSGKDLYFEGDALVRWEEMNDEKKDKVPQTKVEQELDLNHTHAVQLGSTSIL